MHIAHMPSTLVRLDSSPRADVRSTISRVIASAFCALNDTQWSTFGGTVAVDVFKRGITLVSRSSSGASPLTFDILADAADGDSPSAQRMRTALLANGVAEYLAQVLRVAGSPGGAEVSRAVLLVVLRLESLLVRCCRRDAAPHTVVSPHALTDIGLTLDSAVTTILLSSPCMRLLAWEAGESVSPARYLLAYLAWEDWIASKFAIDMTLEALDEALGSRIAVQMQPVLLLLALDDALARRRAERVLLGASPESPGLLALLADPAQDATSLSKRRLILDGIVRACMSDAPTASTMTTTLDSDRCAQSWFTGMATMRRDSRLARQRARLSPLHYTTDSGGLTDMEDVEKECDLVDALLADAALIVVRSSER